MRKFARLTLIYTTLAFSSSHALADDQSKKKDASNDAEIEARISEIVENFGKLAAAVGSKVEESAIEIEKESKETVKNGKANVKDDLRETALRLENKAKTLKDSDKGTQAKILRKLSEAVDRAADALDSE